MSTQVRSAVKSKPTAFDEFNLPNADAVLSEILTIATGDCSGRGCGDERCDVIKRIRGVIKRYQRTTKRSGS